MSRPLSLVALAVLVGGCASTEQPNFSSREYPGILRAPDALDQDVVWRQRVTASWSDAEPRGFDAVIQKMGDTVTILGLSPTGSMGFAIELKDGEIELTNNMPEQFPFPPRNVMLDVQRAFFEWLPTELGHPFDGVHDGVVDEERVVEIWREGKLVQRDFTRLDGLPAGSISIQYTWDHPDWQVPSSTVLNNNWFGYRLDIETQEETLLAESGEAL